MTIRSKLFLFYGIMLAVVIAVGAVSAWTVVQWHGAASDFRFMQQQSLQAWQLQQLTHRQVTYGLDYLAGSRSSLEDFQYLQSEIQSQLQELKACAGSGTELDHIEGLEETQFELNWVVRQIGQDRIEYMVAAEIAIAQTRLREIADEVSDDIAAVNQHYHTRVQEGLERASQTGEYTFYVIGGAVLVSLFQLLALAFLSQRWLVRPIDRIGDATRDISTGNFDARISVWSQDEWAALADSVNAMASSLKSMQRQLRSQERFAALGEVVAYTSHNLRNPLSGIRATAQVTLDELPPEQTNIVETCRDIIATVDRMDVWIQGMMKLAAPVELHREPTTVQMLVEEAVGAIAHKIRSSKMQLEIDIAENLPAVHVDPPLIQQVIASIVTNACESGGNQITIRANPSSVSLDRSMVEIEISDNGTGMSADAEKNAFSAFVTDKEEGTGLGLALARKIVELHGGEISFQSETGEGTEVLVKLDAWTESHGKPGSDREKEDN